MFYFEHCFREARSGSPSTVAVVGLGAERWASGDVDAEIRDLFPEAAVSIVPPGEPIAPCDLAVVSLAVEGRPLEDVAYRTLSELRRLLPACRRARHVLVFRARWREAEIIPARTIGWWLWRRRLEAWCIRRLQNSAALRLLAGAQS